MLLLSITFIYDIFNIHLLFTCTDQQWWFCWSQLNFADSSTEFGSPLGLSFMWPLFPLDRCLAWEISFFGSWRKYKRISKGWGCLLRLRRELTFFFISTLFNQPKQVIYFNVKSRTETAFVGRTATVKPSQKCISDSVDEVREHWHNTLSVPSQIPATHCNSQKNIWLQNVS